MYPEIEVAPLEIPWGIPITEVPERLQTYFASQEAVTHLFNKLEQRIVALESELRTLRPERDVVARRLEILE